LFETNELVDSMKIQLINIGPLLTAKNEATKVLMDSLVIEKAQVDEVRQVVLADEAIVKVTSTFLYILSFSSHPFIMSD
jgi:hypothetical protein